MSARTKKPAQDRRRRRPPVPCGPAAAIPAIESSTPASRRAALRFGLRDRAAAILQDLRDLNQDAPGLITSAAAFADAKGAEEAMRRVLNHLQAEGE